MAKNYLVYKRSEITDQGRLNENSFSAVCEVYIRGKKYCFCAYGYPDHDTLEDLARRVRDDFPASEEDTVETFSETRDERHLLLFEIYPPQIHPIHKKMGFYDNMGDLTIEEFKMLLMRKKQI